MSVETLSSKPKPSCSEEALLLEEGRRQLGGIKVFYWFTIMVIFIPSLIALLSLCLTAGQLPGESLTWDKIVQGILVPMFVLGMILVFMLT